MKKSRLEWSCPLICPSPIESDDADEQDMSSLSGTADVPVAEADRLDVPEFLDSYYASMEAFHLSLSWHMYTHDMVVNVESTIIVVACSSYHAIIMAPPCRPWSRCTIPCYYVAYIIRYCYKYRPLRTVDREFGAGHGALATLVRPPRNHFRGTC